MHVACAHRFSNLQNHQCVSQVNTNNEDRHTVRITYYIQLTRKKYSVPLQIHKLTVCSYVNIYTFPLYSEMLLNNVESQYKEYREIGDRGHQFDRAPLVQNKAATTLHWRVQGSRPGFGFHVC